MQAFDLVDTLVHINYSAVFGHASLLEEIKKAKVIYRPQGEFLVFTAQQDSADIHDAISEMVHANFPDCRGISFVAGGEASVIAKKGELIKTHKISDFTDNNRAILAGLKKLDLGVKLWVMTKDGRKPY